MDTMTIREALHRASSFLREYGREERVGELLLEFYTGLEGPALHLEGDRPLSSEEQHSFMEAVRTHALTGKPYQHITGEAHFYGRHFTVTPDVLIPRQETEELMDLVRSCAGTGERIADIGTGSGVLAVTLALETEAEVSATDISPAALEIARQNSERLRAEVRFFEGSFLTPLEGEHVDILVSNPPYISWREKEELDTTVRDYDPELALFAEEDGLAAYAAMCRELKERLQKPRLAAFEIGHTQGEAVARLLGEALPGYRLHVHKDLNGKDRFVTACH
ncbi:peptide chain release factor N(5)-glutamine methyltransferase [Salimicrobium salexigens]|uniref:Release factor glutamine methyltransferase n=1 Tax=Salimicrobium salexigens TaxID=908941 RepID=A0ABY1KV22_9BACI|nr:peptide chain release factor N(5)-glutamine methyltransferase [Salimicrobium salexigens]SIS81947.1 release factor glutamine methyltransferase [Salimicrobium salexigens]